MPGSASHYGCPPVDRVECAPVGYCYWDCRTTEYFLRGGNSSCIGPDTCRPWLVLLPRPAPDRCPDKTKLWAGRTSALPAAGPAPREPRLEAIAGSSARPLKDKNPPDS